MKKIFWICSLAAMTIAFALPGCQKKEGIDDDLSFLNNSPSSTNNSIFDISEDNSGLVKITPTGEGASSFVVHYGHGTGAGASAVVMPGNSTSHNYPEGSYTVTIVSKSVSGQETTNTYPLTLTYRAPENLVINTTAEGHTLKVSAEALYANGYQVYFGEDPNETPVALANGAEVSHTYSSAGQYTVKVVALSGGQATTEETTDVTIFNPFGLPITFEDPNVNYFFGTFGGGQQFAKVANPDASGLNTSAQVGKFTRGWEWWSGTYSPLQIPIDLSAGKKIKVLAYNPDPALIGARLNVELESGSVPNGVAVLKTAFTTSGAWEELVFDFGTIGAIPNDATFSQLVLRFNDSADGAVPGGHGAVIYIDNITLTN